MNIYVIGGGAAGFFGAIRAAECFPNAQVTILEKTGKVLQKVKVSGGGRCNVTHQPHPHSQFAQKYPRGQKLLKKRLGKFSAEDTIHWFQERGVITHTEADGRVFPVSNQSESIIACFRSEAERLGIRIELRVEVKSVIQHNHGFILKTKEKEYKADRLLIATGGSPKAEGYQWLTKLGHSVNSPLPSLFTFNLPGSPLRKLAGISVPEGSARLEGTGLTYDGPILITHWGLSGPAILKLSAYGAEWLHEQNYEARVLIRWVPQTKEEEVRQMLNSYNSQHPERTVWKYPLFEIPSRLWIYLCQEAEIGETDRWVDLSKKKMNRLLEQLYRQPHQIKGKTTFKEEFVTCGGIPTDELDQATMESKLVPGLFFAGEVLHVDGITGGFNFQAAWTTAWLAGSAIGNKKSA